MVDFMDMVNCCFETCMGASDEFCMQDRDFMISRNARTPSEIPPHKWLPSSEYLDLQLLVLFSV